MNDYLPSQSSSDAPHPPHSLKIGQLWLSLLVAFVLFGTYLASHQSGLTGFVVGPLEQTSSPESTLATKQQPQPQPQTEPLLEEMMTGEQNWQTLLPPLNEGIYRTGIGNIYRFSGVPLYPGKDSFSLEFWTRYQSPFDGVMLSSGEESPFERYWGVSSSYAGDATSLIAVKLNSGNGEIVVHNVKNLYDGQWHHAVFVRDKVNGVVRLYVDGILEGELIDTTDDIIDQSSFLHIGSGNVLQRDWFDGELRDIVLYQRALSEGEVHESYLAGL